MKAFTITHLVDLIGTKKFERRLADISLSCSFIKQEREILAAISSLLWQQGYHCQLEVGHDSIRDVRKQKTSGTRTRFDLQVGDKLIQAKYNYDFDVLSLDDEKKKAAGRSLTAVLKEMEAMDKSYGWTVSYPVLSDITDKAKRAHLFMWIIACRNLNGLDEGKWREYIKFEQASKKLASAQEWVEHIQTVEKRAKLFLSKECKVKPQSVIASVKNRVFDSDYIFLVAALD